MTQSQQKLLEELYQRLLKDGGEEVPGQPKGEPMRVCTLEAGRLLTGDPNWDGPLDPFPP